MAAATNRKGLVFAAALPVLLAACSTLPPAGLDVGNAAGGDIVGALGSGMAAAPEHVVVAEAPSEVYTRLARQVYACWLASEPPLLPGQQFYAEAEPGDAGNARISLHIPGADGQKGLRTYAISMRRSDGGTQIETEPLRIEEPVQRQNMHAAVMGWARGETACIHASEAVSSAGAADAAGGAQAEALPLPQRKPRSGAAPKPKTALAVKAQKAAEEQTAGKKATPSPAVKAATTLPEAEPAHAAAAAAVPTKPIVVPQKVEQSTTAVQPVVQLSPEAPLAPTPAAPASPTTAPAQQQTGAAAPAKADALPAEHKFLQSAPGFAGR